MSYNHTSEKVEHLIALQEGLYSLKEKFLVDRKTLEFQSVFEKSKPLVSICVATYNRADLLVERSLHSLLNQTYDNIEIIVVGDHCSDHTAEAIHQLNDSRIKFHNLPRRGPYPRPGKNRWCVAGSNAMNHAMDLCQGDFIAHLDDDDQFTNNKIAELVEISLVNKLEFVWHRFSYQHTDGTCSMLGSNNLQIGQVTTGSIFYHRYFTKIKWDVYAFRLGEPGDWNRIRKIKFLEPKMQFVDQNLLFHFMESNQLPFEAQEGEEFIEF